MLDRERILTRLDTLERYERELREVVPASFEEYLSRLEARRACERVLQIAVECIIDLCHLFVTGLRLGLPGEEDDLFDKLETAAVVSPGTAATLRKMKGFRNILVHEYGEVNDRIVFRTAGDAAKDFPTFRQEILQALRRLAT